MVHLEDEDIARLIDGSVSRKERERFLKHLSECDSCLSVYNESLTFMEQEEAHEETSLRKEPDKTHSPGFLEVLNNLIRDRRYQLAAAALLVIVIILPFFLGNHLPIDESFPAKRLSIEKTVDRIEFKSSQALFPSTSRELAAVRIGIFVEDLALLVHAEHRSPLKENIIDILSSDLLLFVKEDHPILRELTDAHKGNLEKLVHKILVLMEDHSKGDLFRFGRFIESTYLGTYENKQPSAADIDKHKRVLRQHKELPRGVSDEFQSINDSGKTKQSCKSIKEIVIFS